MLSPERYERASELFLELCDLAPAERAGRLEELEANDTQLHADVVAMLARDPGESQLQQPAGTTGGATAADQTRGTRNGIPRSTYSKYRAQIGDTIDRYRLEEELGAGGMGVVFAATQRKPIRRRVALKIIKPGTDTREIMQRFEAERQALALMDHPHIASVLDAGQTEAGLPYFVMELVRGVPITQFCDERKLSSRERLRLFVDVCAAVQHAHQKAIIHRDLKPHNILVTLKEDQPVIKVIDFGVAKALHQDLIDDHAYTAASQLVGTPIYMSPEQADLGQLDIDTRSDIYSLGVLLYELLTGSTPIDPARLKSSGYDEVRRIIREEEPPRPSTRITRLGDTATTVGAARQTSPAELSNQLSGDLDLIVMKALEKDRARRYETATGFADDIERYLNDEPITARAPTVGYRAQKFYRRNRSRVLVAASMLLLLIAGIIVTWISLIRTTEALTRAEHNEAVAEEQSALAMDTLQRVVEQMQIALQFSGLAAEPRREILQAAQEALDAIDKRQHKTDKFRRALIMTHMNMGDVLRQFGTADGRDGIQQAMQHYEACLRVAQEWVEEAPESERALQEAAFGFDRIGWTWLRMGRFQEAEVNLEESLEITQSLIERFDSPQHHGNLVHLHHGLAITALKRFDVALAAERWQTAQAAYERAKAIGGRSLDQSVERLMPMINRSVRVMDALPDARKDVETVFQLPEDLGPRVLYDLASWYCYEGDHQAAAEALARMTEFAKLSASDYYSNACGYSKCIPVLLGGRQESGLGPAELEVVAHYRTQAVDCLKRCVEVDDLSVGERLGWITGDADFAALHNDPAFEQLLEDLRARKNVATN